MTAAGPDDAELAELRAAIRDFLEDHAEPKTQREQSGRVWPRLTGELGLTALGVADAAGGAGAGYAGLCVAVEEAGRALLRDPFLPTAVAAAVLAGRAPADASAPTGNEALAGLLDGSTPAALLLGEELSLDGAQISGVIEQAPHAEQAAVLLVAAGGTLRLVCAGDARVTPLTPVDPTRPQARVELAGAASRAVGDADALRRARSLQSVAVAAECVGATGRILELTVDHLKVRQQFGRPLGSFQALRHRVADLTVAVEAARSALWYASRAADGHSGDLDIVAPLAQAVAVEAFLLVAGEGIQLHGGIGFTDEHVAHLYFKRAWTTALQAGDPRALRRLAAERAGLFSGGTPSTAGPTLDAVDDALEAARA